jgi:UDP-2-acetamido-3-amino-2,3-dideoxy-glucuronate N-acetyltransferase
VSKIGIIGAGYWGKNLVRNFHQLNSIKVVCDKDKGILDAYKDQYPDVDVTEDYKEVLEDAGIDGVVIAAPAAFHHKLVKEALLKDKHVFVEKPLALHVDEGKELVEIAKQRGKVLMVGHILRYHPAVIKLKELIDKGELGDIRYVYSNRLNIGKIRTEENILWSFAPHDISVILMLLDEYPESLYTTGGVYLQHNIADVTMTNISFPDGVRAHIFVSWLHPFKEQKLVVVGDRKMAVFDDMTDEKLFLYSHKIEWKNSIPVTSKAQAETVSFEMVEPLKAECQHFLDCMKNNGTPVTDGNEGLRVLGILQASQESLDSSGKVVHFEEGVRDGVFST